MKRILFYIVFTTLFLSTLCSEQIRIMYNQDLYPLGFANDRGKAEGFAIDILYALARESAFEVLFLPGDWRKKEEELLDSSVDFVAAYGKKSENSSIRTSKVLFSVPFSLVYRNVLRPSDEEGFYKRIPLVSSGDSSEPLITERNDSTDLIRTKSWSDAVEALNEGYGDYTIISSLHWNLLSERYNENLSSMDNFEFNLPFVLFTTKWNSQQLEKMNNSLSIIKASGEFDRLYRKWFGDNPDALIFEQESNNFIGIFVAVLIAISILIIISIRRRKVKT